MIPLSASARTAALRPARTGLGWFLQCLSRPTSATPEVEAVFPATERWSAQETFVAAFVVGLWSLAATLFLSQHSDHLPFGTVPRFIIGLLLWLACLHLTVILPMLVFPVARCFRLSPSHLAPLVEAALLLFLTLLAWHLTTLNAVFPTTLGTFWITLIMADLALRLARAGIVLASRPH